MPGAWKSRPVRQSSRNQGVGQDTVERHGGFDVVMETIVQWEQDTPYTFTDAMLRIVKTRKLTFRDLTQAA